MYTSTKKRKSWKFLVDFARYLLANWYESRTQLSKHYKMSLLELLVQTARYLITKAWNSNASNQRLHKTRSEDVTDSCFRNVVAYWHLAEAIIQFGDGIQNIHIYRSRGLAGEDERIHTNFHSIYNAMHAMQTLVAWNMYVHFSVACLCDILERLPLTDWWFILPLG